MNESFSGVVAVLKTAAVGVGTFLLVLGALDVIVSLQEGRFSFLGLLLLLASAVLIVPIMVSAFRDMQDEAARTKAP